MALKQQHKARGNRDKWHKDGLNTDKTATQNAKQPLFEI